MHLKLVSHYKMSLVILLNLPSECNSATYDTLLTGFHRELNSGCASLKLADVVYIKEWLPVTNLNLENNLLTVCSNHHQCHLDEQGLLHQQLLSSAMIHHSPNGLGRGSPTHTPLQLTSLSFPSCKHLGVLQSCLQSLSCLPNVHLS